MRTAAMFMEMLRWFRQQKPKVRISIDVFRPDGVRAVLIVQ